MPQLGAHSCCFLHPSGAQDREWAPRVRTCTPEVWVLPVSPRLSVLAEAACCIQNLMGSLCSLTKVEVSKVMEEVRGWLLAVSNPGLILLFPLTSLSTTNFYASVVLVCKPSFLFLEYFWNSSVSAYYSWLLVFSLESSAGALLRGSGYSVHLCFLHSHVFLASFCPSHFAKGEWWEPAPQNNLHPL